MNNRSTKRYLRFFSPKSIVSPAILLLGSLVLLTACSEQSAPNGKPDTKGKGKRPQKVTPVEVQKPKIGLAASYYVTTATIEPSSDASINARTSGAVRELLHEEGDDVTEGEVLLVLEDDDQKLRLKQAEQKYASSKREYQRLSKMRKAGAVSPTEWEATENAYKVSETDKELAELGLSYTRVAAPFTGRVVWREVDLGEYVAQGALLFRMMAIDPLLIRVYVPANRVGGVTAGQRVTIKVDSQEETLTGIIQLVSPIVDPNTGTLKVTIQLDDYPKNVRPGDFSEVHMITDQHQGALLVPSTAIIEERGQNFVYVVQQAKQKTKAKKIEVSTGFVMATETEIISGLSPDDKVIVKGQRGLNDDVLVEILTGQENAEQNNAEQKKLGKKGNKKQGTGQLKRSGKKKPAKRSDS